MQILLSIIAFLLGVCALLLLRCVHYTRDVATLARRLYKETSTLFPCYTPADIALSLAAVDRAFVANQAIESSGQLSASADARTRIELIVKRVHAGRVLNLALKQRDFQLQANLDVLSGARSVANARSDERALFWNPFEAIVPEAINSAISEAVCTDSDLPGIVHRYASGESWNE